MSVWSLVYEGFEPAQEGLREALCTLSNGYFATRGAAPEADADDVHYPGTYLAGGYNRLATQLAGRTVENEDLVNLPNWLPLSFRLDGGTWFSLRAVELLSYRQELDLHHGLLLRSVRFRDPRGRVCRVAWRRFVHLGFQHLAGLQMTLTPENWSGSVDVRSALDGRVINAGVARYRELSSTHLECLESGAIEPEVLSLKVRTTQSRLEVAQAARVRFLLDGEPLAADRSLRREPGYIGEERRGEVEAGHSLVVEKIAAVYSSRDRAISECAAQATQTVATAGGFDDLLASHVKRWERLWQRSDITIDDRRDSQHVLRLHVFHLLQTLSPNTIDLDVGVPARGLHGEAYRGHVFWDELFVCPTLTLRIPDITRATLRYRSRRLNRARLNAREAGLEGAMYPWQSGSDGREESQVLHLNPRSGRWTPDNSRLQRHVNAAVAYNVWQYYQVTNDWEFLVFYGAEMILEIARFWASLARYNPSIDRYEIRGVMGPDEYHDHYPWKTEPGLDNNAYTNVMAAWVLCRALEVLTLLDGDRRTELRDLLTITPDETQRWEDISRKLTVPHHDEGIISQFEGYERLEEFDWDRYRRTYGNIQRLDRILEAEGDSTNRYKVSKQADVLMLFFLFSSEELGALFRRLAYPFAYETIPRNIDYYLRRTSDGSSLSRMVHAWVLARSDRERSWKLFTQALEVDVADVQGGTTPEGIHLGAMAGSVDIIQRAYTGIETRGDTLYFNPRLPTELGHLSLCIYYRGHSLAVGVAPRRLTVVSRTGRAHPIHIAVGTDAYRLGAGETIEVAL